MLLLTKINEKEISIMNYKIRRLIFLILVICNCLIIFNFSNQKADISGNTSGRVVKFISELIPSIKNMPEDEKIQLQENVMQPIVRKLAHFSIYTLLGILLMNFTITFKRSFYQCSLGTIILGFLYACSDEFHQLFIYGRSCEFRDVCIDTLGVITGAIIVIIVTKIYRKVKGLPKSNLKLRLQNEDSKDIKALFISSTGGHFSELMQLKELFNEYDYHIVTEKTKSNKNLKEKYHEKLNFLVYGTKKTPFLYIFILLANCFISLFIYLKVKPHVVITTGTHTAGPMCCIAKILGSKVIYIETFANRNTKTQAGKLLYYVADTFVVQWDEMLEVYPKAKCFGWIY